MEEFVKLKIDEEFAATSFLYRGQIHSIGGYGVKKDFKMAAEMYTQAVASTGSNPTVAKVLLAGLYLAGDGVDQSYDNARRLYELACREGNDVAMFKLGVMIVQQLGTGEGSWMDGMSLIEIAASLYGNAAALSFIEKTREIRGE